MKQIARKIGAIKATIACDKGCTEMYVSIVEDNLHDSCKLYIAFFTEDEDSPRLQANMRISGDDYANWDGNNDYPYEFAAQKLGVNLITE